MFVRGPVHAIVERERLRLDKVGDDGVVGGFAGDFDLLHQYVHRAPEHRLDLGPEAGDQTDHDTTDSAACHDFAEVEVFHCLSP